MERGPTVLLERVPGSAAFLSSQPGRRKSAGEG